LHAWQDALAAPAAGVAFDAEELWPRCVLLPPPPPLLSVKSITVLKMPEEPELMLPPPTLPLLPIPPPFSGGAAVAITVASIGTTVALPDAALPPLTERWWCCRGW